MKTAEMREIVAALTKGTHQLRPLKKSLMGELLWQKEKEYFALILLINNYLFSFFDYFYYLCIHK